MDIYNLTANQLKRAAVIKEQIAALTKELRAIFGAPARSRPRRKRKRTLSVAAKKKIAAAQRARWASIRRTKPGKQSVKTTAKAK